MKVEDVTRPRANIDVLSRGLTEGRYVTVKCPSCGDDMEPGHLISARPISWCDHVPKAICRCGDRISRDYGFCTGVAGHRCKKCHIIVYITIKRV
ncbi:MAG: PF20097 family protein [Candidatus Thorarchaeota archaeon]